MTHYFEFIVIKKQTEEEKKEGKEPDIINLVYETKSKRTNKVAEKIKKEVVQSGAMTADEIQDIYLRPTTKPNKVLTT